ncbi:MAG TPA: PqqD family protein [Patescibacteria group bacterium]|nr:PqqD family protein [Patescibacteria group bacterium]
MAKHKIKKGIISDKLGQKLKIFDSEKSVFHTFNDTATFIFNQLKHGQEEHEILKNLVEKYKISEKEAHSDLSEFLKDLKSKGIID